MTYGGSQLMAQDGQFLSLGDRLGGFLSTKVSGPGREKRLAQMIKCDPRTARNLFAGYWPGARQWREIVRLFGRDVLDAVFAPEIDDVLARQKAEIQALERELHDRKAHVRALEGAATSMVETQD